MVVLLRIGDLAGLTAFEAEQALLLVNGERRSHEARLVLS